MPRCLAFDINPINGHRVDYDVRDHRRRETEGADLEKCGDLGPAA
jgi:hypothetical protein